MDNISQQVDEVEALKSIYEDKLVTESGAGSYSIELIAEVKLFITLIPEYPSEKPPKYELLAPDLPFEVKKKISEEFQCIFEESMGSPILFQWIEKLKEISLQHAKKSKPRKKSESQAKEEQKSDKVDIFLLPVTHGPVIEDRKSVFQGHCCPVNSEANVRGFLNYLMENKKIAQATHNIYAYRIALEKGTILQDCDDDGENHASGRLLHLLQILNLTNVMVVVSRWYGGIQLGPDRFKHINNAGRQVLVEAGFIK